MALALGTRLGAYSITAALGAGGMGEVYKATDTRLGRTGAVKVLPEHFATSPEAKQRFEREARTLAALSHPHICPVFDVGTQDGIDSCLKRVSPAAPTSAARSRSTPLPAMAVSF
jgi:serine/threonine protein kinase